MQHTDLLIRLSEAGLVVCFGSQLAGGCDLAWLEAIEQATVTEKAGLLYVSKEAAELAVREHRVVLVYERNTRAFVGCVFLGFIAENWYELGTVYVVPKWRYHTTQLPISQALHHVALALAGTREWDVSETSTVPTILHGAQDGRNGVVLADFDDLPAHVKLPTCCCPADKTGAPSELEGEVLHAWNARLCERRNKACRLMLSLRTAERLRQERDTRAAS